MDLGVYMQRDDGSEKRFWFQFDPTIHAGHVLTALTIILCSIGAWYNITTSIVVLKDENARQEVRMTKIEDDSKTKFNEIQSNLSAASSDQRNQLVKIRDDMNSWFIRLDDKLDKKVDKK